MSNINELLFRIKNDIYGVDMRQSIHDAIQTVYKDNDKAVKAANKIADDAWKKSISNDDFMANLETQLRDLVVEGDSSPQATQASVGVDGTSYNGNLKARLDAEASRSISRTNDIYDFNNFEVNDKGRASNKRGILTFISDDGSTQDYTTLFPFFEDKGVPFCIGLTPTKFGQQGYATKEQMLEVQAAGHEMLSHSLTHPFIPNLPDAAAEAEYRDSKSIMLSQGFDIRNFCIPQGTWGTREKYLGKKYYRAVRTSDEGREKINTAPIETHELKGIWLDEARSYNDVESGFAYNTIDYYKYYIDKAIAQNGWLIISVHAWLLVRDNLMPILHQVVDYAKGKIDIMTMNDALNNMANIVEIGDFSKSNIGKPHMAVGYDGTISTSGMDSVYKGMSADLHSKPIQEFEPWKTTVHKVSSANVANSDIPGNIGGTFYTHRVAGPGEAADYNYQEFHSIRGEVHARTWMPSGGSAGSWGAWVKKSGDVEVKTLNAYTGSSRPSDFSFGKTTINNVNSAEANATGIPGGSGGTLVTYRGPSGEDNTYSYQVFKGISSKEYIRTAVNAQTWGAWAERSEARMTIPALNTYTCSTAIGSFPMGISHTMINNAQSAGSPLGKAGTLITNKVRSGSTEQFYNWQEFHHIEETGHWKRNIANNGAYGNWYKIGN